MGLTGATVRGATELSLLASDPRLTLAPLLASDPGLLASDPGLTLEKGLTGRIVVAAGGATRYLLLMSNSEVVVVIAENGRFIPVIGDAERVRGGTTIDRSRVLAGRTGVGTGAEAAAQQSLDSHSLMYFSSSSVASSCASVVLKF